MQLRHTPRVQIVRADRYGIIARLYLTTGKRNIALCNVVSARGWECVTVSLPGRALTLEEMREVKGVFFGGQSCFVQCPLPGDTTRRLNIWACSPRRVGG